MTIARATAHFLVAFAVGTGAVACSGSSAGKMSTDASAEEAATGPMTLAAFCNGFAAAYNAQLSRCVGGAAATWAEYATAQQSCSSLEAAVSSGRVTYDPSKAAPCLDALPTLNCSDLLLGPDACVAPLTGTVGGGGKCFSDYDCSGNDYCSGVGFGESSCEGKCAPRLARGAACTQQEECVAAYACDGATDECISDIHPVAKAGASCAPPALGNPSIFCATGLSCNRQTNLCAPTLSLGAACTPGEGVCDRFTYCDSSNRTCVADSMAGGVCGVSPAGELMDCLPQLFCKLPTVKSQTGTCTALGGAGAKCSGNVECVSGFCTSQTGSGTCSTPCTAS